MHLKHFFLALSAILLAACSSSRPLKYDNTFAGVGGDQPLALPARITLFAPRRIDVAEPKLEKQFLTRGNEVEADTFATGLSKAMESKGIHVDLRRFADDAYPETADLETMVSTICGKDTSRYSLVIGTLRLATEAELASDGTFDAYRENPISGNPILGNPVPKFDRTTRWSTANRPTLIAEIHLYDHQRAKISRSLRFGSEGAPKKNMRFDFFAQGTGPMMKSIIKDFADTVRVR